MKEGVEWVFPTIFSPIFVSTGHPEGLPLLQEKHSILSTRGVKTGRKEIKNEGSNRKKERET